jgi:dihydrofolate reductase
MTISLIAAMSENRVIGNKGRLPWGSMPADLANLARVTAGCKMVMGRKSYDTPDRIWSPAGNVVITRQVDYPLENDFERAGSLTEALEILRGQNLAEIFVLGGGEVFKEAILVADTIHLTLIHATFEGDAFFPEIPPSVFAPISECHFAADADNPFSYSFLIFKRIS